MMNIFQQAMDQVTLSPEADEHIQAVIEAAQQGQKVISLPGGRAKKTVFRFGRAAVIAAVLAGLLTITALAAGIHYVTLRLGTESFLWMEGVRVSFEQTADEPSELGRWEPDTVPAGFEKVKIFQGDRAHMDTWENTAGEEFLFSYELPNSGGAIAYGSFYDSDRILEQGDVSVNGAAAWYLVYRNSLGDVHTNLYWSIPGADVGFCLSTFDLSLEELITIAEGVTVHG